MIYGIDVSSYQAVDFPLTVAGHKVAFSFIKATEGTGYVNSRMRAQAEWARSHGHVTGFYHFAQPGNMKSQAAYFVSHADSEDGDILILDWEVSGVSSAAKDEFLKEVKRLRPTHRVMLYCSQSYWTSRDTSSYAADGLWIAQYNGHPGKPSITAAWKIHQYTSTPVDTNIADFADKAAMQAWAHGLIKPVTPPSKPVTPKPPTKPAVYLLHVIAAAHKDPGLSQGKTTHPADVKPVEAALRAAGYLAAKYAADGSYGTLTKAAYAKWQKHLGYKGSDADGIPGKDSLTKLGAAHGFTVKV